LLLGDKQATPFLSLRSTTALPCRHALINSSQLLIVSPNPLMGMAAPCSPPSGLPYVLVSGMVSSRERLERPSAAAAFRLTILRDLGSALSSSQTVTTQAGPSSVRMMAASMAPCRRNATQTQRDHSWCRSGAARCTPQPAAPPSPRIKRDADTATGGDSGGRGGGHGVRTRTRREARQVCAGGGTHL
jgi:hypothetical protein